VLQAVGISPMIVEDGRAAVAAFGTEAFDVVLMDIQMPGMDGITATQAIRALEAAAGARPTPILALSANAMKHQVAEYLAAGMDAHIAKPLQIERVYAALQAVADAAPAQDHSPRPAARRA
jgi:CheY-like chemotaxis protein